MCMIRFMWGAGPAKQLAPEFRCKLRKLLLLCGVNSVLLLNVLLLCVLLLCAL